MSRLVRAALIVGVLAIVFAPGAARSGGSSADNTRQLSAAVLAPTTLEQATMRTVAPRSDDLVGLRLAAAALVMVVAFGTGIRRRLRDLATVPHPSPLESRRPHRRGPPLLTV